MEELFDKYEQMMLNICMKVLKNPEDAKDAVEDTFVRIMDNVEKFMEVDDEIMPGFLAVTTRNVACDIYNQKIQKHQNETSSTYFEKQDSEGTVLDTFDHSIDVEQALIDKEFISELKALMQSMPAKQSTVLIYKYFYHLGNTEIAEMLGINRSVVNSRLHHARITLKKLLLNRYSNN